MQLLRSLIRIDQSRLVWRFLVVILHVFSRLRHVGDNLCLISLCFFGLELCLHLQEAFSVLIFNSSLSEVVWVSQLVELSMNMFLVSLLGLPWFPRLLKCD